MTQNIWPALDYFLAFPPCQLEIRHLRGNSHAPCNMSGLRNDGRPGLHPDGRAGVVSNMRKDFFPVGNVIARTRWNGGGNPRTERTSRRRLS